MRLLFYQKRRDPIVTLASKGTGLAVLLIVPLCGPLLWKKATKEAAIFGLLSGLLCTLIFELRLFNLELPYKFGAPIPALLVNILVFVSLSLSSKNNT